MLKLKIITVALLMVFVLSAQTFSSEPGTSAEASDKTEAALLRIKNASAPITTLTGNFIQKKEVEILKDMPDSKGKFFYKKPDCLRWEIIEPVKMGFIVNGEQGKKWRKKPERYKKFNVEREPVIGVIAGQVFAWARGDFDKLREGYEINLLDDAPIKVELTPLSKMEKKYISSIVLTFSSADNYVEELKINEAKGGATQVTFLNMVTNDSLGDIF